MMEIDVIRNFSKDVVQYNNSPIRLYYTNDDIYVVVSDLANCVLKQRVDGGFTNYKSLKDSKHIYVFDQQRIRVVPEKVAFAMVESCSKFSKIKYREGWSKLLTFMRSQWTKKETKVKQTKTKNTGLTVRVAEDAFGNVRYKSKRIKYVIVDGERYFSLYNMYQAVGYTARPWDMKAEKFKTLYVRKDGVNAINPLFVIAESDAVKYIECKMRHCRVSHFDGWRSLLAFATNGWKKVASSTNEVVTPNLTCSPAPQVSSSFVGKAAEEFASIYKALLLAFSSDEARKIAAGVIKKRYGVDFGEVRCSLMN